MTFLFDENISPDVCAALKALKKPVIHVLDVAELGRQARDEQIFDFLKRRENWFLVTQDKNMRRKPHQRQAMMEAEVGAFILTGRSEKTNDQMTVLILRAWPQIEKAAHRERPFIFSVSDKLKVESL